MKRRTVRAVTGLLCAALLLSDMTGIRAFAMEETGQGIQMQEQSPEDGTREEENEQMEETGQADSDVSPETDTREEDTDDGDQEEETQDKEESEGDPETGSEGDVEERPEEGSEEADAEDAAKEQPEEEIAGTVSGNTVEEASDADGSQTGELFFPQVYFT